MQIPLADIFDNFGVKSVSRTDKNKAAYLPNADQIRALTAAGQLPSSERPAPGFRVQIMFDRENSSVEASYYHSVRATSDGRPPEPRMGHQFISAWAEEGDRIAIGNIGKSLFALKLTDVEISDVGRALARSGAARRPAVLRRARRKNGHPRQVMRTRLDFVRDPWVVAGALLRAGGSCEMPNCSTRLFARADGSKFLEVHHVIPLADGGADDLENAAALCPMCHRELHFGALALRKRALLSRQIFLTTT